MWYTSFQLRSSFSRPRRGGWLGPSRASQVAKNDTIALGFDRIQIGHQGSGCHTRTRGHGDESAMPACLTKPRLFFFFVSNAKKGVQQDAGGRGWGQIPIVPAQFVHNHYTGMAFFVCGKRLHQI